MRRRIPQTVYLRDAADRQLVGRHVAGDPRALVTLLAAHRAAALQLWESERGLDAVGLQEDLHQELAARVLERLPSCDIGKSPGAWVLGIARNLGAEVARVERRQGAGDHDDDAAAATRVAPTDCTPDALLTQAEETTAVSRGVAALSPHQRRLVRLRYVEGHTPRTIAANDGVPAAEVRAGLRNALREIRARAAAAAAVAPAPSPGMPLRANLGERLYASASRQKK